MSQVAMAPEMEEASKPSGGVQMLLDRWRLQEDKLRVFENSLKEVNTLATCRRVNENLEAGLPESLQEKINLELGICSNELAGDLKINECSRVSARSSLSSQGGLGLDPRHEEGFNLCDAPEDESLEDFEKRVWQNLWKDEDFMIDDANLGSVHLDVDESVEELKKEMEVEQVGKENVVAINVHPPAILQWSENETENDHNTRKDLEEKQLDIITSGDSVNDYERITEEGQHINPVCKTATTIYSPQKAVNGPMSLSLPDSLLSGVQYPGAKHSEVQKREQDHVLMSADETVPDFEKRIWRSLWNEFRITDNMKNNDPPALEARIDNNFGSTSTSIKVKTAEEDFKGQTLDECMNLMHDRKSDSQGILPTQSRGQSTCQDASSSEQEVQAICCEPLGTSTHISAAGKPTAGENTKPVQDRASASRSSQIQGERGHDGERQVSSEHESQNLGNDALGVFIHVSTPAKPSLSSEVTLADESMESFENRIWGKLWEDSVSGSHTMSRSCTPKSGLQISKTSDQVDIKGKAVHRADLERLQEDTSHSKQDEDNLHGLTRQRAKLVEDFMAAETERRRVRENAQQQKSEDAARQQGLAAEMQQFLNVNIHHKM